MRQRQHYNDNEAGPPLAWEVVNGRRDRRPIVIEFTGKTVFAFLGVISVIFATFFWHDIQHALYPDNNTIAWLLGFSVALGAPALLSFLVPMSAAGMLHQKTTRETTGFVLVVGMAIYYLYYTFQLLWSWNAGQQVVADTGIVYQQVIIQMCAWIGIPALLFTAVSSRELVAAVEQAQFVKRYEVAATGELVMIEQRVKKGAEYGLKGLANLTVEEAREYAGIFEMLLTAQEVSLENTAGLVEKVSGVALPNLPNAEDVREVLQLVKLAITNKMAPEDAERRASAPLARIEDMQRRPPRSLNSNRLTTQDREYRDYEQRREPIYDRLRRDSGYGEHRSSDRGRNR